jgi:3-deoxy-manno-octulosonate cytidylyltransferase (CMP-KDO synthetase)
LEKIEIRIAANKEELVKVLIVIPARYASSRFGGKVLAKDTGKFLVQHTYERALCSKLAETVLIATDSERVLEACKEFGGQCVMTSDTHRSGTDRIAEAVAGADADIIVNLQADEPLIEPENIDLVAQLLIDDPEAEMATLVADFQDKEQIADPNVVKCIVDTNGRAIYFSRSVIPYDRDAGGAGELTNYLRHLGIYAYRRSFLLEITKKPQTPLELSEKLEQLRVLEYGHSIVTGKVKHSWEGIDTPQQYAEFVKRVNNG